MGRFERGLAKPPRPPADAPPNPAVYENAHSVRPPDPPLTLDELVAMDADQ